MDLHAVFYLCTLFVAPWIAPASTNSIPQLKIHGKWQAINANPAKLLIMLCVTIRDQQPPPGFTVKWSLTPDQRQNRRIGASQMAGTAKSILRVLPPLQPQDQGEYICDMCNEAGTCLLTDGFNLTLYDAAKQASLNVSVLVGADELEVREFEHAQWTLLVSSSSARPVEIEQRFGATMTEFYDYDVQCALHHPISQSSADTFLHRCNITKTNVSGSDSMVYYFVVNNWVATRDVKLRLFVYPRVQFSITGIPAVYQQGSISRPVCNLRGLLMTELEKVMAVRAVWHYEQCDIFDPTDCDNKLRTPTSNISLISTTTLVDKGKDFIKPTLEGFRPRKSGVLVCLLELQVGTEEDSKGKYKKVCVSDGPHELQHTSANPLTEGETAQLSCSVSNCNYNSSIRWFHGDSADFTSAQEAITQGITVSQGMYSTSSHLLIAGIKSGVYFCQGQPHASAIATKTHETFYVKPLGSRAHIAVIAVIASIAVMAMAVVAAMRWRQQRQLDERNLVALLHLREGDVPHLDDRMPLHEQAPLLPFHRKWEFPREKLTLGRQLGSGCYGFVLEGVAQGIVTGEASTRVAVKMPQRLVGPSVVAALVGELKILSHLGRHPHVVNLLGAVVDRLAENELMVIVELCPHGSLNNYLADHKHRFINQINLETENLASGYECPRNYENTAVSFSPENENIQVHDETHQHAPLNTGVLKQWSYQVARGMEWLASKRVLHGDLAARNVLLSHHNIVKISDFGLAKSISYYDYETEKDTNAKLPVKWMALESLETRKFSSKSDVWAFGVTMWELFSLASTPYPEFATFREVWQALRDGYRMPRPFYAPQDVYQVMLSCWQADPQQRPAFSELTAILFAMLDLTSREKLATLEDHKLNRTDKCELEDTCNDKDQPRRGSQLAVLPPSGMYLRLLPPPPPAFSDSDDRSPTSLTKSNLYVPTPYNA